MWVVTWTSSVRWLKTLSVIPLGRTLLALDLRHLLGDRLGRRQRLLVLAHQDDALDDVVLVAPADDPLAGLVPDDDLGDLADVDRACRRRRWR